MKKFSKESMQQFMLMHAEKLILGACLAATGLFVWMSMGGEEKSAQTPKELLDKANSAETYINRDNWAGENGLEQFRKGKVGAKDQIANTQPVDGSKFMIDIIGPPVETLAPRKDPFIVAPEQLIAHRFIAGVMMDLPGITSPLKEFSAAPDSPDAEGKGAGFSGFQGGDDYGDDYNTGGSTTRPEGLLEEYQPLKRSNLIGDAYAQTVTGIRPEDLGISDKIVTTVRDVVCVTAVVDFQKQAVAFEQAFADSIAYNAKRDRPVYQCLQVQRRETSGQAEWVDITENVTYRLTRFNPLKPMPFQVNGSAPEVISPDNFDPILSQAIPAFAQFDYQQVASHPALKTLRQFPDWVAPKKDETWDGEEDPIDDIFDRKNPADEMELGGTGDDGINSLRNGTETELYKEAIVMRKPGGQYRLVRFFDLQPPRGKSVEYRVRVWVGDPNQSDPTEGFKNNRGMQLQVADQEARISKDDDVVRFAAANRDGVSGSTNKMDQHENDDQSIDGSSRREVLVDVQKTMLTPPARKRVAGGTEFEVMNERLQEFAIEIAKLEARSNGRSISDKDKPKLAPFHVAEYSDDGQLEQIEIPTSPGQYAYIRYLRFARPSAWSDSVQVEKASPNADVLAGTTVRTRPASVELGGRVVQFAQVEPSVKVVVSHWVSSLGAKLPAERDAYVGETMNFNEQAYVTHPISWQVLVPEIKGQEGIGKYTMPFRSNETIVDVFFGDTQELPTDKRLSMELATEILTMDANGTLNVSNQFAAEKDYRNELAMPDDSRYYGKPRKQKAKKDEYEGDGG